MNDNWRWCALICITTDVENATIWFMFLLNWFTVIKATPWMLYWAIIFTLLLHKNFQTNLQFIYGCKISIRRAVLGTTSNIINPVADYAIYDTFFISNGPSHLAHLFFLFYVPRLLTHYFKLRLLPHSQHLALALAFTRNGLSWHHHFRWPRRGRMHIRLDDPVRPR